MVKPDMSKNLKEALAASPYGDVRELADALGKDMGERAPGYSTVTRYFTGTITPPLETIVRMARLLGARPAYLAFGDGQARDVTPIEEHLDESGIDIGAAKELFLVAPPAARDMLRMVVGRLVDAEPSGSPEPPAADVRGLAERLASAVFLLVAAIQVGTPVAQPATSAGIMAILSALLAITPAPGEGRPIAEMMEHLPVHPAVQEGA